VTDRPRALAVLIAVFLLGCIAGAAGSYYWLKKGLSFGEMHGQNMPPSSRRPGPGSPPDLRLTPEQDARFKEIMTDFRNQLDAVRAEQSDKMEAIRAETNRKLAAILNQEQQKKFNEFLKSRETMRRHPPRGRDFSPPPQP
jgi:Spy/CpxP family protein refolding chaperone